MIDCTEEALDKYGDWLGAQVLAWKPSESIEDLRDLLAEVREVVGARNRISGVDSARIGTGPHGRPASARIPEWIGTSSYPIWAMSATGGVLTGECADRVETILDVIQTQTRISTRMIWCSGRISPSPCEPGTSSTTQSPGRWAVRVGDWG
jgi:hypothetical protein